MRVPAVTIQVDRHRSAGNRMRSVPLALAFVFVTIATPASAQALPTPAAEIAPTGSLRVGFQIGSPILAKRAQDGSVSGVVVDLGKYIAAKLGVKFDPVIYANQEAYAQSFGNGEWDVVIGVRSALTDEKADRTPDFMVADAMYIAGPGREFIHASTVDRPGVKVGVSKGGGSDQHLSRSLRAAHVVRIPGGVPNAIEALRAGTVDVWAANPVTLQEIEDGLPGSKVVPGAWTTGRYAAFLPRRRSVAARDRLVEIIDEARRTGVVQGAIDRAGFKAVHVAPD